MTRRRIALIIDDEPDITTYFGTILSDNDWDVRTANSAEDGLVLAREEAPNVVLLDVLMPGRGGLSTLIALRKDPSLAEVPVILVTGIQDSLTSDFGAFLDRFKHYHPDAYLEKPVTPEQLMSVVNEVAQPSPAP
jgi:two-component system, OmpR family, alkaline phosphatase synthesis response regulator PhoP